METLWHMLMALATIVAPLLLAWWMLARGVRQRDRDDRRRAERPKTSDTMEP